MIQGITELLADLNTQFQANNILNVKTLSAQLFRRKFSVDDLKEMVVFLEKNYNHKFMPLLAVDHIHALFPELRFDVLTSILIKCAKKSMSQEVNMLLSLKGANINIMGCMIALTKLYEMNDSPERQAAIKSILNFRNGEVLKVKKVGRYSISREQKDKMMKLRGVVLFELAKVGNHEAIREHGLVSESTKEANIQCALCEAAYQNHFGAVRTILDCYLLGNDALVLIESQLDQNRIAQALLFAKEALKYAHSNQNIKSYLEEFILRFQERMRKIAQVQAREHVEQKIKADAKAMGKAKVIGLPDSKVETIVKPFEYAQSYQAAASELAAVSESFKVLRFSLATEDEPIQRQEALEEDEENLEKEFSRDNGRRNGIGM